MKQVERLAQYYVELLLRLGLFRSSLLVALVLVVLLVLLNLVIKFALLGQLSSFNVLSSTLFGVIFTPCAIYFFSSVVFQLAESRQRYCDVIMSLEEARASDLLLNEQLKQSIEQLNQEIEERERIEKALHDSMRILKEKSVKLESARFELDEQTTLLRSFLDASPDLIYYRNEKGQFSGCNKAIEALTGKSRNELIGLTPWEVYPISDATEIVKTDQLVFDKKEPITYEHWLQYPDGRKACFEMRKIPFYSSEGELLGLLGFGREITEHKSHQDALLKASRDKTTFISTISHELRTPLNAIVGFSRQLLDSQLSRAQYEQLRTIYVSAVTLGQIFNGIIDLDKADRGRLELFPEPTDLSEVVSGIEHIGKLMAEQDGLSFSFNILDPLPESVLVDATRLRQILWNLLSNAFKFTKQGSVNISLSCQIENKQVWFEFAVEDSGIGISKTELANIFAMYYQVKQNENNLHATGTGIGLAISRENAELMGGVIDVNSELGFGSTFTFKFSAPICESQKLELIEKQFKKHYHLLLVEDIELNVTVAINYLRRLGHSVIVARTGQEALDFFAQGKFDLVLLDIQLPDMTGFEIVQQLQHQYAQLPPFIALTANAITDKNKYLEKGMNEALSKPFTLEDLTRVINNVFNQNLATFDEHLLADKKQARDLGSISDLDNELSETLLDLDMLNSYVALVGLDIMNKNVRMFEQIIKDYLIALELNLIAKDQEGIVREAHKIKGAASAVGLKHIQEIANKAQSPALPAWWDNINDWVDEIKLGYQHDLTVLNNWLARHPARSESFKPETIKI